MEASATPTTKESASPAPLSPDGSEADMSACPLEYVNGNVENYLPCKPGTFLCKSEIQFYTCGKFGGESEWSYGALRDVAPGMSCEPKLSHGSAKRSLGKRQDGVIEKRASADNTPNLKALGEGVDVDPFALFGPEPAGYEEEWGFNGAEDAPSLSHTPSLSSAKLDMSRPTKRSTGRTKRQDEAQAKNGTTQAHPEPKQEADQSADKHADSQDVAQDEDEVEDGVADLSALNDIFGGEPDDYEEEWPVYPNHEDSPPNYNLPRPSSSAGLTAAGPKGALNPLAGVPLSPAGSRPISLSPSEPVVPVPPVGNLPSKPKLPGLPLPNASSAQSISTLVSIPAIPTETQPNVAGAILPYFMGPGPVMPSSVTVSWPGPSNLRDANVPSTPTGESSAAKRVKRQACPPVPSGYHREDQYVVRKRTL